MRPPEYHFPIDSRRVRRAILRFGIFILAIIALFQSISFYVDGIWFESLGYGSVFWYRLRAEALVFLGFAIASAVVLWCLFRFLVKEDSGHHRLRIGGEWVIVPSTSSLRGLSLPIAIILGILFGLTYSTNWNTFALFFNRPPAGELSDPVFGRPLSFYFFSLPVLESIAGWFLAISIITVVVSLVVAATHWTGGLKGVSLALSLLLAALALETYVGRYDLILDDHALFSGVRYVDAHFLLPGLLFVVAALILGAVVAAVNVRSGRLSSIGIAIAIPALTYAIAGVAVPLYVTTFIVRPNELVREKPYIQNNIEFTRKAFGLDKVEEIPFEPRLTNAVIDPGEHPPWGLARLAGYAPSDSGNPHVLRLRGCGYRPVYDRRPPKRHDAGGARVEPREAALRLSELDQRTVDLHTRLWCDDESRQPIHEGGSAAACPVQYAG